MVNQKSTYTRCWNGCGALSGRIDAPTSKPAFCSDLCARSYARRMVISGKDLVKKARVAAMAAARETTRADAFMCQAQGCGRAATAARLCDTHYQAISNRAALRLLAP